MRTLARRKIAPRARVSVVQTYPSPIGGWNARDALTSMKPYDAVTLKNWYPRPSYVEFRGGYASHATGLTGNGKTLAIYNKMTGSNEMYAYTATGIYDVTAAGAVGASKLARTDGKHQWVMFGDGSSNWLIAVNGLDKPAYYDGSAWTAVTHLTTPALTAYTGDAVEEFISVNVFKGRLFFIPVNSLSFWYLPAGDAGGALLEFSLAAECKKGGYLIAMATWTRDAGDGMDDLAVFVTSEGEVIVYQGNNPSNVNAWANVGRYAISKPLGRRAVLQYGADCLIMTETGVFPIASTLGVGEERDKFALSYKIQNAFVDASRAYGGHFGWRAIAYPAFDALLVNVPILEDGEHEQYVMNTLTKAWTKFTEWDAEDFAVFNGQLYFCSGTAVYKAWTGAVDGSNAIVFYGKQAFQDFGDSRNKLVSLYMPILSVNGSVAYGVDIDMDFADDEITGTATYSVTSGAEWDVSNWDESYWASGLEIVKQWSSPAEWQGRWISSKIKITSSVLTAQWSASVLHYIPGDNL